MAPTRKQLDAKFKALGPIAGRGSFVRAVALQFQDTPLSAIGSIRRGGRYNPRGDFEAFYLGKHPDTVVREIKMVSLDNAGNEIVIAKPPQVLVTVRYDLRRIADLTDPAVRRRLGVTKRDLLTEWSDDVDAGRVPITHTIGLAARAAGFEALLVPSARNKGENNLVVFVDQLRVGSVVEIYDPTGFAPGVETRIEGKL